MATLVELTANIVTSNVSGSGLSADELVAEINKVFVALKTLELTGAPDFTRHTPSDESMVLAFSSPVYSQMDIAELPAFEEELKRQYKRSMSPEPAAKLEKKKTKAPSKPEKASAIPAKNATVKEAVAPKTVNEKKSKVKA